MFRVSTGATKSRLLCSSGSNDAPHPSRRGAVAGHGQTRKAEHKRSTSSEIPAVSSGRDRELVAIDDALSKLAELDARKARVIELRFFGGLSVEETAAVLNISGQSVMRRLEAGEILADARDWGAHKYPRNTRRSLSFTISHSAGRLLGF